MKKGRYYFNTETLQFEKVQKTLKQKLQLGLILTISIGTLVISTRLMIDDGFNSPKIKILSQKNQELKESYNKLNTRIAKAENILSDIRLRDDKLYRSVFDLEPIPRTVREAGFGGSEDYSFNLESGNTEFVKETARKLDQLSTRAKIQSNSLVDLYSKAQEQKLLLSNKPSIKPISPADHIWLTSTFGYRTDPFHKRKRMHQGIDLAGQVGINIYATGNGIVKVAEFSRYGYGNEVFIDHGFGYESIYGHLDKIFVEPGDSVKKGELIGTLGNTGRSTGPHLHYEIRKDNRAVNPMYYYYDNLSAPEYSLITQKNR